MSISSHFQSFTPNWEAIFFLGAALPSSDALEARRHLSFWPRRPRFKPYFIGV